MSTTAANVDEPGRKVQGPKIRTYKPTRDYESVLLPGEVSMARLAREVDAGFAYFMGKRPHLHPAPGFAHLDFHRYARRP